MRPIDSLTKKLAQYSALASVAIVGDSLKSNAQVIYHDLDPDVSYFDSLNLDLNNDGAFDFKLLATKTWYTDNCTYGYKFFDRIFPLGSNSFVSSDFYPYYGKPFNQCETINANLLWSNDDHLLERAVFWFTSCYYAGTSGYSNFGPWSSNQDQYLGIRLNLSDGTHYGWIRLNVGYNLVKDYAYQAEADVPIQAGQFGSCDSIEVSISPEGTFNICAGTTMQLSATVTPPYHYEWLKNGVVISGATSSVYTVSESGTYQIVGYNCECGDTSAGVTVNVISLPLPTITRHVDTLFSSEETGNSWWKWTYVNPISHENFIVMHEAAIYKLSYVDSNGCSSGVTTPLFYDLCDNLLQPIISNPDLTDTICAGDSLFISSTPSYYYHYQWLKDDQPILGATNTSFLASEAGNYSVVVKYIYDCLDTSSHLTLNFFDLPNPVIVQQADTLIANYGTGVQWLFDGVEIPGAINQVYLPIIDGYYQVRVTDVNGCVATSDSFYYHNTGIINLADENQIIVLQVNDRLKITIDPSLFGSRLLFSDEMGIIRFKSDLFNPTTEFDVSDLTSGIYFAIIRKEGKQFVRKIILQ